MKRISLFVLLLVLTLAHAGEKSAESPRDRAERFLARIGSGEVGGAYDDIFAGSPVVTAKPQALDAVKRQTEAALPIYGKALGFELHKEKKFGDSLVRLTYIQKLEQHPVVWQFWFYRPKGSWYVDNVSFNDQYQFLQCD
jgi:hypothetical protein